MFGICACLPPLSKRLLISHPHPSGNTRCGGRVHNNRIQLSAPCGGFAPLPLGARVRFVRTRCAVGEPPVSLFSHRRWSLSGRCTCFLRLPTHTESSTSKRKSKLEQNPLSAAQGSACARLTAACLTWDPALLRSPLSYSGPHCAPASRCKFLFCTFHFILTMELGREGDNCYLLPTVDEKRS